MPRVSPSGTSNVTEIKACFFFTVSYIYLLFRSFLSFKLVSVVSFFVVSVVSFRSFRWFRFGRSVSLFLVLVHAPENRHFFSKTSCIFMLLGNLFTG